MEIRIKACQNIDKGTIQLEPGILNVKYGQNGTGKSTLAKAVLYSVAHDVEGLSLLRPYKYEQKTEGPAPSVYGVRKFRKAMLFNESYVQQYVFQSDDLHKDSFKLFLKPKTYDVRIAKIEELLKGVRKNFRDGGRLVQTMEKMQQFSDSFGRAKSGYSKGCVIDKGIARGNRLESVPEALMPYNVYFQDRERCLDWMSWVMDGMRFGEGRTICPFCASDLRDRTDRLDGFRRTFDLKEIKNHKKGKNTLVELMDYFSKSTCDAVKRIVGAGCPIGNNDKEILISLHREIDLLLGMLNWLRDLGYKTFPDVGTLCNDLKAHCLNIETLPHLESRKTKELLRLSKRMIDGALKESSALQKEIGSLNSELFHAVVQSKNRINSFLETAGYRYFVECVSDEQHDNRLVLNPTESSCGIISDVNRHLSFGEKNALALMLFLSCAIRSDPDLIILDDPISSFDGNKKFALLEMMFFGKRQECLKGKTVLMLTHDFDPVISIMQTHYGHFSSHPRAWFMHVAKGNLKEKEISSRDLCNLLSILDVNIKRAKSFVVKLVYLRRLIELTNGKDEPAYNLISSLLHLRKGPMCGGKNDCAMLVSDVANAEKRIRSSIPSFTHYREMLNGITHESLLHDYQEAQSSYEKLQIFRVLNCAQGQERFRLDDVTRKFVNETYHVENERLFQLDPREFDTVPDFILERLDECVKRMHRPAM